MAKAEIPANERKDLKNMAARIPSMIVLAGFMLYFAFSPYYPVTLLLSMIMSWIVSAPSSYTPVQKSLRVFVMVLETITAIVAIGAMVTGGALLYESIVAYFLLCILSSVVVIQKKNLWASLFSLAVYSGLATTAIIGLLHGAVVGEAWFTFVITGIAAIIVPIVLWATKAKSPVRSEHPSAYVDNQTPQYGSGYESSAYYEPKGQYPEEMPPM